MRKQLLVLSTFLFIAVSPSLAQVTKGSLLLGGNVSLGWYKAEPSSGNEYTSRYLWLSPSLGVAVKENRIFGIGLLVGSNKSGDDQNRQELSSYGGLLYYRPYLALGKGFYLFGQMSASFTTSKNEQYVNSVLQQYQKQQVVSLGLYPGVSYAVNHKIHLEAGINNLVQFGYSHTETSALPNGPNKSSGFGLDVNAASEAPLSLGFRILLRK